MNKNNNTTRLFSRFLLNFGKAVALLFVIQHCCFGQQLPNIKDISTQIQTASDFQDSSLGASVNSMLSRQPKGANSSTVELIRGTESLEISFQAFAESGLFEQAVQRSPELQSSLRSLNKAAYQLQRWQQFQLMNSGSIQDGIKKGLSTIDQIEKKQIRNGEDDKLLSDNKKRVQELRNYTNQLTKKIKSSSQELKKAEQVFDVALQQVISNGFNGAQVARIRSSSSQIGGLQQNAEGANVTGGGNFVLLKANGTSSSNTGYSVTRLTGLGQQGITSVPSEYLLPTPANPDDLFFANSTGTQRLPDGVMLNLTNNAETNPIVRLIAAPHFGVFYDTGRAPAAQGNFAAGVALDGGNNPAAGQTGFFQGGLGNQEGIATGLDLVFDTQVLNVGGYSMQVFADANNHQDFDDLNLQHVGVRLYNRTSGTMLEGWSIVIGKTNSLFTPVDLRPTNIQFQDASLIGFGERPSSASLAQLAVHIPLSEAMKWRIGIEEPYTGDLAFTGGTQAAITANTASTLTRWPTLSTNLEIGTSETGVVLGGLLRSLGYQGVSGEEFFDESWGLSAVGRIKRGNSTLFMGFFGGDGIGDYITGISNSAVVADTSFQSVESYGSFLGYQNTRLNDSGGIYDQFNMAYGYSWMETPLALGNNVNQKLQQAWVNYQRQLNQRLAIGLQYEYGFRQIASGDQGDNNRLSAILSFRTGPTKASTRIQRNAASVYNPPFGGLDGDLGESSEVTIEPKYLNGKSIDETVNQTQLGGPAHKQRF